MYRKRDKRYHYHVDYAFASQDITKSASISIGKVDEWLEFSDHMPVILDIAAGYLFGSIFTAQQTALEGALLVNLSRDTRSRG